MYQVKDYRLTLNSSAYALSPQFTADLSATGSQSPSAHASSLIAKYGSLYIREATFGYTATQNDFVPIEFYRLMSPEDRDTADAFFGEADTSAGRELVERMRRRTSLRFHRRTSLVSRGGDGFAPHSMAELPVRVPRPVMTHLTFAPLSDLLPESSPLKDELAQMARSQLLVSVVLNLLDIGLLPEGNNWVQRGEAYFAGLQVYIQETEAQFAHSLTVNGSTLVDRASSPFIKLSALAMAKEFIGKRLARGELPYTSLFALTISPFGIA